MRQASLFIFLIFAGAHPVFAKDTVVHIAFTDGLAITQSGVETLDRIIVGARPDTTVIPLTVSAKRLGYFTKSGERRVRNRMIDKIKRLSFENTDAVRMTIISTHGSTTKEGLTSLSLIGKIGPDGLDSDAQEFFEHLKGRMNIDGRVVLESCSTMCGTEESAIRRSKSLLEFLGATRGSLFGAVSPLSSLYSNGFSWKYVTLIGLVSLGSAEALTITSLISDPSIYVDPITHQVSTAKFGMTFLTNWGAMAAIAAVTKQTIVPFLTAVKEAASRANLGRLMDFSKIDGTEVTSVRYNFDRENIFGLPGSCERLFTRSN